MELNNFFPIQLIYQCQHRNPEMENSQNRNRNLLEIYNIKINRSQQKMGQDIQMYVCLYIANDGIKAMRSSHYKSVIPGILPDK